MSLSSLVIHCTSQLEGFGWMDGLMAMGKSEGISRLLVGLSIICVYLSIY